LKHPLIVPLVAVVTLALGGPAVAASQPDEPSPIPAWAKSSSHRDSGAAGGSTPAGKAADVTSRVFDTSDDRFDQGVDNQGWWATSQENEDANDNYVVGSCNCRGEGVDRFRNFFSFDLSTLKAKVVGATLVVRRYRGTGDFTETYGLYDVHTGAKRLNNNRGVDVRIYRDLGSGTAYGRYVLPTDADATAAVRMRLNGAAIADLNAARGGFFSIGGKVLSIRKSEFDQTLFGFSRGRGMQRLVVYTESPT
jgi:hypothetical protein